MGGVRQSQAASNWCYGEAKWERREYSQEEEQVAAAGGSCMCGGPKELATRGP